MSQTTGVVTSDHSDPDPIAQAAQPGQSESEINEKIRDAGYEPYPSTDDVADSIYRDRLTSWLNERAGIAFVSSQHPDAEQVRVTFELPYGGTFTQQFTRRDAPSQDGPTYQKLLSLVGLDIEDLDDLAHRPVPLRKTSSGWEVDVGVEETSRPLTQQERQWQTQRRRHALVLAVNRVINVPLVTGLAFALWGLDSVPERIAIISLLFLVVLQCFAYLCIQHDTNLGLNAALGHTPGWVSND